MFQTESMLLARHRILVSKWGGAAHLFSGELDGGALSHGERQLAAEHEGALNHLPGVRVQPPGGPFRLHQARGARRCLLLLHRQEPLQQRLFHRTQSKKYICI